MQNKTCFVSHGATQSQLQWMPRSFVFPGPCLYSFFPSPLPVSVLSCFAPCGQAKEALDSDSILQGQRGIPYSFLSGVSLVGSETPDKIDSSKSMDTRASQHGFKSHSITYQQCDPEEVT